MVLLSSRTYRTERKGWNRRIKGIRVMTAIRKFGPKDPHHPSIGVKCLACHEPFIEGDYTTLVSLGPGGDPEEQKKARNGRHYNSVGVEIHYTCATGIVV